MNLKTFFKNIFNTKEISDANLSKFAQTHQARLTAANAGGVYGVQLTAITTTYNAFVAAMNAEDVEMANQQGTTITTDTIFANFKAQISQKEGIVRGIFGINSAEYQSFFPLGLTEYSTATKANVEMLMNRIVAAATTHSAALTPDFLPLFTGIKNDYAAARTAQLLKIGNVESLKSATATARQTLTNQLMTNLLIIASNNVGDTTMLEDFFDQSFIRPSNAPNDGSIQGTVLPNQTVNIEDQGIDENTEFIINNTGTQPLSFGIVPTDTTPALPGVVAAPNDTLTVTYMQLLGANPPGSMFFNVTNANPETGSYKVWIE